MCVLQEVEMVLKLETKDVYESKDTRKRMQRIG